MSGNYTIEEIAKIIEGIVYGNKDVVISGVASIEQAKEGDIVFLSDLKLIDEFLKSKYSAVIISEEIFNNKQIRERITQPVVVVKNVRLALLNVLDLFYKEKEDEHFTGIHPTAIISKDARIKNVAIGGNVIIESNVSIGEGTVIYPNCYIGKNVRIGSKCVFFPGVCIYRGCIIGNNVRIHAGTVIGSDGFGYITTDKTHRKILQVGIVEIGDDVEIGSNVTIDRATVGKTIIGAGTKIDNLVHIAHNVKIGKNCLIAGQVGIAGSSKIYDNVMMGGQAGISDHVVVGEGAVIAAQAGVIGNIKSGDIVTGFPARPIKEFMKAHAVLYEWINKKRLPNR